MDNAYGDYNTPAQQQSTLEAMMRLLIEERQATPDEVVARLSEEQFSRVMLLKRISSN